MQTKLCLSSTQDFVNWLQIVQIEFYKQIQLKLSKAFFLQIGQKLTVSLGPVNFFKKCSDCKLKTIICLTWFKNLKTKKIHEHKLA